MTGSETLRIALVAAAIGPVGMVTAGCAIGEDAVTDDTGPSRAPTQGVGPGFIGDRGALMGAVMERLNADPSACETRDERHVRCRFLHDVGG